MRNKFDAELDLPELLRYMKKKLWILGAALALCAIAGYLVSALLMTPRYTASTRMYVLSRADETNVVYSDIQTSTYLLSDYRVLITGQNVTKEVIRTLGLDMKYDKLEDMIQVTAPENTRILQINVFDTDPKRAADIANCVREVSARQLREIMDVDAVKLVYEAEVPEDPVSPNVLVNTLLAAAFGLVAAIGILTIAYVREEAEKRIAV